MLIKHCRFAMRCINGIQLLLDVILVIRYDRVDSFSQVDSILFRAIVIITCIIVEANAMSTAVEDLPWESSGQFNHYILIAKIRNVNGRFSKSIADTLLYYSKQCNWYVFKLVIDFFRCIMHSSTNCDPLIPPNSSPGNLIIFPRFSSNSIGIKKNDPINVSKKTLFNFLKQLEFLKNCGSKSP